MVFQPYLHRTSQRFFQLRQFAWKMRGIRRDGVQGLINYIAGSGIEATPKRVAQRGSSAEEPVTARILRRTAT
jgi:hypothetical protein